MNMYENCQCPLIVSYETEYQNTKEEGKESGRKDSSKDQDVNDELENPSCSSETGKENELGIPKYLLSIQISWQENYLALSQEQYIYELLEKYNFLNCKPTSTPMDCGTRLEKARPGDSRTDKELYQSKIGCLLYLAMGTRPDIAHTVNVLSQYCVDPSTIHNSSVHHLFRYLKGSMHYKLIYKPVGSPSLKLYSDASFANSLDDRRSYTGFVAFYGGSVVCWCTKKQQSVAVSTTEAEYYQVLADKQCGCHNY
ncbi:hypothetical protein JTB14_019279 [Gonioctena quinquepunctata]|nr:hypothetical protein JTB14_019279 [Gonioctena quinquepunctata]